MTNDEIVTLFRIGKHLNIRRKIVEERLLQYNGSRKLTAQSLGTSQRTIRLWLQQWGYRPFARFRNNKLESTHKHIASKPRKLPRSLLY